MELQKTGNTTSNPTYFTLVQRDLILLTQEYINHLPEFSEKTLGGHVKAIKSARFNPQGTKIVTASRDNTAKIWDVKMGALIHTLTGHTGLINSARFNLQGTQIVTASNDKKVIIWDAKTGFLIIILDGHADWANSAQFDHLGLSIVTASWDGTAKIWPFAAPKLLSLI